MSAAGPSNYSFFQIRKPKSGLEVRIEGKILGFNYYESLYSPMVTGSLVLEDTGGSVEDEKTGILGTIKDGMKISGFEEVSFQISTRYGELNFKNYPLIVTGSPSNFDLPNRQTILLNMVSKTEIDSSKKPLTRNYPEAPISETVTKILNKELKISESKLNIEKTKNQDKIKGNHQGALDCILKMCKKSIPAEGKDPGYFFYETQDGHNFRSIDGLIKKGIEDFDNEQYAKMHTYYYFGSIAAKLEDENGNDFKVLTTPNVVRDEDQLKAMQEGLYCVRIITKNSLTGEYKEEIKNLLSDTNLGEKQEKVVDDNDYLKTYCFHISPGADDPGVSDTILNNPADYVPQSNMRYSLLHSQVVQIQVPCNVQLKAGEVIKLYLENITQSNKNEQIYNNLRSGFYLIKDLCHAFSPTNSYTSLTLLRDTRELYRSSK